MSKLAALVILASCARSATPVEHVEILPLPQATATAIEAADPDEDPQCKNEALTPVAADANGELDKAELRRVIARSLEFATRCCSGDEEKDAMVLVTVSPEGYTTTVSVTPESTGPTNACLYATFHRVMTKPFQGDPLTVRVPIHVRSE